MCLSKLKKNQLSRWSWRTCVMTVSGCFSYYVEANGRTNMSYLTRCMNCSWSWSCAQRRAGDNGYTDSQLSTSCNKPIKCPPWVVPTGHSCLVKSMLSRYQTAQIAGASSVLLLLRLSFLWALVLPEDSEWKRGGAMLEIRFGAWISHLSLACLYDFGVIMAFAKLRFEGWKQITKQLFTTEWDRNSSHRTFCAVGQPERGPPSRAVLHPWS